MNKEFRNEHFLKKAERLYQRYNEFFKDKKSKDNNHNINQKNKEMTKLKIGVLTDVNLDKQYELAANLANILNITNNHEAVKLNIEKASIMLTAVLDSIEKEAFVSNEDTQSKLDLKVENKAGKAVSLPNAKGKGEAGKVKEENKSKNEQSAPKDTKGAEKNVPIVPSESTSTGKKEEPNIVKKESTNDDTFIENLETANNEVTLIVTRILEKGEEITPETRKFLAETWQMLAPEKHAVKEKLGLAFSVVNKIIVELQATIKSTEKAPVLPEKETTETPTTEETPATEETKTDDVPTPVVEEEKEETPETTETTETEETTNDEPEVEKSTEISDEDIDAAIDDTEAVVDTDTPVNTNVPQAVNYEELQKVLENIPEEGQEGKEFTMEKVLRSTIRDYFKTPLTPEYKEQAIEKIFTTMKAVKKATGKEQDEINKIWGAHKLTRKVISTELTNIQEELAVAV